MVPSNDYTTLQMKCLWWVTLGFHRQNNAKAHVEQTYRNKLKKAGIKEQFVKETGDAVEGLSSSSSGSEDESHNKYLHT